jgi:predicted RNA-binding protein with PUA-like domain
MARARQYWLVKQEPSTYPFARLLEEGRTVWDGVRNYQARNHLQAMRVGDRVLYYHSGVGTAVVGIAEVTREAFPDPTTDDPRWVAVELRAVKALPRPVTLERIKADPALRDLPLVRQSRLSVMPLPKGAYDRIVALGT